MFSRFGEKVKKVISGDLFKNEIDVIFESEDPKKVGKIFQRYISDFCADGGIEEIATAIEEAKKGEEKKRKPLDYARGDERRNK